MKRKTLRIICSVLVVILVAGLILAAVFVVKQRENLKALATAGKYTKEELDQALSENTQAMQSAVKNAIGEQIREVTEEERKALAEGTLTAEELVAQLIQPDPTPAETPQKETQTGGNPQEPGSPAPETMNAAEAKQRVTSLIAETYVLREEYQIALDNMVSAAKADYRALPQDEGHTAALARLIQKYFSQAQTLEAECDKRVNAIAAELETLAKEYGGDPSLAQTVRDTYAKEKSIKKAQYMNMAKEKGLI